MTSSARNSGRSPFVLAAGVWLACVGLGALLAPWLPLRDPLVLDPTISLSSPTLTHWLGTDTLGRDVASRVVYASRTSAVVVLLAALVSLLIGGVLGMTAGLRGGLFDRVVQGLIDALWSVPMVVLGVLALAVLDRNEFTLALVLGAVNWVTVARTVRTAAVRVRREDYVTAAQALGFSMPTVLWRQILPVVSPTLTATVAYAAADAASAESGLAALGLGVAPPTPTWGALISESLANLATAPWLALSAAFPLILTVLCLHVIARAYITRPPRSLLGEREMK